MRLNTEQWNIVHLRRHLQYAVDLEFWTIPFYLSAQYSIVDRRSDAYQRIQTIVHQEMLHVQLIANVANAFGLSPSFGAPRYEGQNIPHLNFALDNPDPRPVFSPYSAEIGPFDRERLNAMCLIEYPEWGNKGGEPRLFEDAVEYGSIGEFYDAIAYGATLLKSHLRGGIKQVDYFSAFYRNSPSLTVSAQGEEGFRQAMLLIDTIRAQGEGKNREVTRIPPPLQNTADDADPSLTHFNKFDQLRGATPPAIYPVKPVGDYTPADRVLLEILAQGLVELRGALRELFDGQNPGNFVERMVSVGAGIQSCWKHGVLPRINPS